MPADRPTFAAIREYLSKSLPPIMKAIGRFEEVGKMTVEPRDSIIIIEGQADCYWWKGQNQRTFDIGQFPRYCGVFRFPLHHLNMSLKMKNFRTKFVFYISDV